MLSLQVQGVVSSLGGIWTIPLFHKFCLCFSHVGGEELRFIPVVEQGMHYAWPRMTGIRSQFGLYIVSVPLPVPTVT